jgi:serine carboxypeptidase-like clade 4
MRQIYSLLLLSFLISCDRPSFLADFECPSANFVLPVLLQNPDNRGYLEAPGGKLFYWLVPAQNNPSTAPLVLWLNGGPGSSSLLGMWFENGPYFLNRDFSTYANPFSWNRNANIIYVDQPAGTGFSNTSDVQGIAASQDEIAIRLNAALNDFFGRAHPEFQDRRFFVFGESFAGTYIPWLTSKIIDEGTLNLVGIGIGDGTIDDLANFQTTADYALQNGLILPEQADYIQQVILPACEDQISYLVTNGISAYPGDCAQIDNYVASIAQNVNYYDIMSFANYDLRPVACYLNNDAVKSALGIATSDAWALNNGDILRARSGDSIYTTKPLLKKALDNNVRVLVYQGEKDLLINHLGMEKWLASDFGLNNLQDWHIGDKLVGRQQNIGLLTYSLIYGAGHLVPFDQPEAALQMFEEFVF